MAPQPVKIASLCRTLLMAAVVVLVTAVCACSGAGNASGLRPQEAAAQDPLSSPDPFAVLEDRSPVVAYEYGLCTTDADCVASSCGGAACTASDVIDRGICVENRIAACLASLDGQGCGCIDGTCRWARNAATMQCALRETHRPGTRVAPGAEVRPYPLRLTR